MFVVGDRGGGGAGWGLKLERQHRQGLLHRAGCRLQGAASRLTCLEYRSNAVLVKLYNMSSHAAGPRRALAVCVAGSTDGGNDYGLPGCGAITVSLSGLPTWRHGPSRCAQSALSGALGWD